MADVVEIHNMADKIIQPAHAACAAANPKQFKELRPLDLPEASWAQSCGICRIRFDGESSLAVEARK